MLYERVFELNDPSNMTYTVCEEPPSLIYVFSTQAIIDVVGLLEKEVNEVTTYDTLDLKDMSLQIPIVSVDMLLDMLVVSLLDLMRYDYQRDILRETVFDLFWTSTMNKPSHLAQILTPCRMLVAEMLNILDFTNARNENIASFKLIKRHVANTLTVRASLHHR